MLIFFNNITKFFIVCFLSFFLSSGYSEAQCTFNIKMAEPIFIVEKNVVLTAKIDTGAQQSSLSAMNIQIYHKNKHKWVKFVTVLPNHREIYFDEPLYGFIKIKKRDEEFANPVLPFILRPTVALDVEIAKRKLRIIFNLTDRRNFKYPALIGSADLKKLPACINLQNSNV